MLNPYLHRQGEAHKSIVGKRPTRNPGPAATSILGTRRLRKFKKRTIQGRRRRSHRGNPLPAAVAAVTGILGGKLGKRLKSKEAAHAERMALLAQLAERALNNDASALAEIQQLTTAFATQRAKDAAKATLAAVRNELSSRQEVRARERAGASAAARREQQAITTQRLGILSSAAGQVAGALTRAPKGLASRAAGVLRGAGRASSAAAGVGGTAAAAGGASAAAVAGVVIAGLAVGALIGTGLRRAFGEARAVRAEEAAVEANLALRRARADLESRLGRKVTQAEARQMFDAATEHLKDLGFIQNAQGQWHRPRSAIERLLG